MSRVRWIRGTGRNVAVVTLLGVACLLWAGCSQSAKRQAAAGPQRPKIEVIEVNGTEVASAAGAASEGQVQAGFTATQEEETVLLEPGDEIEVKFYYTPELDVVQVIRPDGYISMQLVGEVKAQGKTPAELAGELTNRYGWHLKNPQITVIVRSLRNRRVYVGGYVTRPGIVLMPGPMTLMEAIVEAGGFDMVNAKVENVLVLRYENGQKKVYSVNLRPAIEGGEVPAFMLRPKDVIYVPQTRIAKLGQWVEQHINAIVPRFIHIAWYPTID